MTKKHSEALKWQDKFPIGSRWRTRLGEVVEIVCYFNHNSDDYPITGRVEDGALEGYTVEGRWNKMVFHEKDLIERIDDKDDSWAEITQKCLEKITSRWEDPEKHSKSYFQRCEDESHKGETFIIRAPKKFAVSEKAEDDKEENHNIEDIFEEAATKLNKLNESRKLEDMDKPLDWKDKYPIGSKWKVHSCFVNYIETVIYHGDNYVVTYDGMDATAWQEDEAAADLLEPYKEPEEITGYVNLLENGYFHVSYSKMETFAHYRVVARKKITIRVGELDD